MRTALLLIGILALVVLLLFSFLSASGSLESNIPALESNTNGNNSMTDFAGTDANVIPNRTVSALPVHERLGGNGLRQAFDKLSNMYDLALSSDEMIKWDYAAAIAVMDAGQYADARSMFEALNGYQQSQDYISQCEQAMLRSGLTQTYKNLNIGDYIALGTYEQDNNFSNGSEQILWKVIGREEDRLLVISLYALDCQRYHETFDNVTWQTCTLRQWLNEYFFNTAFNEMERAMISTVTVTPDRNPVYDTYSGNATQDKIFLLSIAETKKYMPRGEQRLCWPTEYAVAQGAWVSSEGECWWWLRTPGDTQADAAGVFAGEGGIHEGGNDVDNDENAIRPAMWIELEP